MKFTRIGTLFSILIFFSLLAFLFTSDLFLSPVQAGTITVDSNEDVIEDTGKCTLREAIISANTDTPSGSTDGECVAGSGPDTISLEAATYGLTMFNSNPAGGAVHIWILAPLTIMGAGEGSTFIQSEAGTAGIFYISGTTVDLLNLTLAGGNTVFGGAIYNANFGSLDITNTTFIGNSAGNGGAIYNAIGSTMSVAHSNFSNNISLGSGGAIYSGSGTVTITDTTFSGNSAGGNSINGDGGAIFNSSILNITESVLSGNTATKGGAITNGRYATLTIKQSTLSGNSAAKDDFGNGGGIQNDGTLTLINSTLSGNIAGGASSVGGGITNGYEGTVNLFNSTLSGNSAFLGGGIRTDGTVNITNTIIANSPSGGDCVRGVGNITNVNTLVEDGSCFGTFSGDPNLGPLADNGGPTLTHDLLPGSWAINMGSDIACVASPVLGIDQRGQIRPQGAHCDIGAVESALASPVLLFVYLPLLIK